MIASGAVRLDREPSAPHHCRDKLLSDSPTDSARSTAAERIKYLHGGQNHDQFITQMTAAWTCSVFAWVANRRLRTLENLESLFGHPPSRIRAVHGVLPCSVQIPTVATRTGLCDGCFGASITCLWWLDCEGCRALMTLRFQKQQHASLNTARASTTFAFDNRSHHIHFVVRSSRVVMRVWKSKTTVIVMHVRS
jgi:hypothetical protein